MVASVDNLTAVSGVITGRRAHEGLSGWDLITLRAEHSQAVPGMADLLGARVPGEFDLAARQELLGDAGPGSRLSCRIKLTPAGIRCEAHPSQEHFQVASDA